MDEHPGATLSDNSIVLPVMLSVRFKMLPGLQPHFFESDIFHLREWFSPGDVHQTFLWSFVKIQMFRTYSRLTESVQLIFLVYPWCIM